MTARSAFIWLSLLTAALLGLTAIAHSLEPPVLNPQPARHVAPPPPISGQPTLTAGLPGPVIVFRRVE